MSNITVSQLYSKVAKSPQVVELYLKIAWSSCNWRVPWKNRICSTTMKLRKSLVKPVTQLNILSCLVLPPKIVMHDTSNVILWTSANICVIVHDDLGRKNRTTRYNCRFSATHWLYKWFSSAKNVRQYICCTWQSRVEEPNNT